MYDDDGIKILCSNVRKLGGSIPDSTWVNPDPMPNPNAHVAPDIAKPGKSIPTICKQRLILAVYVTKLYTSISRPKATANLSRSRLKELKQHKSLVENHEELYSLETISKTFTAMKFLDQLPTYL